jgi:hypothetical protein
VVLEGAAMKTRIVTVSLAIAFSTAPLWSDTLEQKAHPSSTVVLPDQNMKQSPKHIVLALSGGDHVSIVCLGLAEQVDLEVFNANGVRVYDSVLRNANSLVWKFYDNYRNRLPDGIYELRVTVVSSSRNIGYRSGILRLSKGKASIEPFDMDERLGWAGIVRRTSEDSTKRAGTFGSEETLNAPSAASASLLSSQGAPGGHRGLLVPYQWHGARPHHDGYGEILALRTRKSSSGDSIVLYDGTPVHVTLKHSVSSKKANPGDRVFYEIEEDIREAGLLIIPGGTVAAGRVSRATTTQRGREGGKLDLEVLMVRDILGRNIRLRGLQVAYGKSYSLEDDLAALALEGGGMFAFPFALILRPFGGDDAILPQGSGFTAYVDGSYDYNKSELCEAYGKLQQEWVKGRSVIYIFRELGDTSSDRNSKSSVFMDGVDLVRLPPGWYAVVNLDPATHHAFRLGSSEIDLDLEGGKKYYISVDQAQQTLSLVPPEVAGVRLTSLRAISQKGIRDHQSMR